MAVWAEIAWIDCEEVDLQTYEIKDEGSVLLTIGIGERGNLEGGADNYQFVISTLELYANTHQGLVFEGRGYYFVDVIDSDHVRKAVEKIKDLIHSTWGENMHDLSIKLSWHGIGEFEGMYPPKTPPTEEDHPM